MPRLDALAERFAHRSRHRSLAAEMNRPDIAQMFDDEGKNISTELLEWSARQALEDYARAMSRDAAIRLAGEFITSALKGHVR